MCGIFAIVGVREATPAIVESLKRLEYRGYDSAGIATLVDGEIHRRRAVGKLSALISVIDDQPIAGLIGIGHTRWATHGAPTVTNAHPQMTAQCAVVHNGIIENFKELREELRAQDGVNFASETDTETVVQWISKFLRDGAKPMDAALATIRKLRGAFALCMIFRGYDDLIIAARRGSPLAVGYGKGEMYVGSDALALCAFTNRIMYLEEGDVTAVSRADAQVFGQDGVPVKRKIVTVPAVVGEVDKGHFNHFMAKEIHEQPTVARAFLSAYISTDQKRFESPIDTKVLSGFSSFSMTACGTAYYAGCVAKYWLEEIARIPVSIDIASELRYRIAPMLADQGAVFVSQSGETADTLAALRHCRQAGQQTLAVVNVPNSSIARESDLVLPTMAGVEIGVASTKAFVCQLLTLAVLSALTARERGHLNADEEAALIGGLMKLPAQMEVALGTESVIASAARDVAKHHDILYLGRGAMYPIALEGALKLKEISYLHAEGYAAGELKHGPIALISEHAPVVVLAPSGRLFEKTVSNMQEIMARAGRIVLVTDQKGAESAGDGVWKTIVMPDVYSIWAPILYSIPVQLLAYHAAVERGTDVDQPRNLAKSVTVE